LTSRSDTYVAAIAQTGKTKWCTLWENKIRFWSKSDWNRMKLYNWKEYDFFSKIGTNKCEFDPISGRFYTIWYDFIRFYTILYDFIRFYTIFLLLKKTKKRKTSQVLNWNFAFLVDKPVHHTHFVYKFLKKCNVIVLLPILELIFSLLNNSLWFLWSNFFELQWIN
jgi:hypothetical protein